MCNIDSFTEMTGRLVDASSLIDIDASIRVRVAIIATRVRSKDIGVCLSLLLAPTVPCGLTYGSIIVLLVHDRG